MIINLKCGSNIKYTMSYQFPILSKDKKWNKFKNEFDYYYFLSLDKIGNW
jgi:hypothetical protein